MNLIYTLRYGEPEEWLERGSASLKAYADKHGHELVVWEDIMDPPEAHEGRFDPKFSVVLILRHFLESGAERMLYADGDIFIHRDTPDIFLENAAPGIWVAEDLYKPIKHRRHWHQWTKKHYRRWVRGWTYRNAGIWIMDRESAEKMLQVMKPPFFDGMREQHQFNWWLSQSKATLNMLDQVWNCYDRGVADLGWFVHLAGGNKNQRFEALLKNWHWKILEAPPEEDTVIP